MRAWMLRFAAGCAALALLVPWAPAGEAAGDPAGGAKAGAPPAGPVVIAHRGASGYLPEHTLAGYAMAYALGADYIEQDVVMTRDGVPIVLHDIRLDSTTDAAALFPGRARADGHWYAADFTLAEIRRLHAHERTRPDGRPVFPGRFRVDSHGFSVPTFAEAVELVQELNRITGCRVGLYPEIKAPAFHHRQGLPIEEAMLEVLARHGLAGPGAPVFIQSFDADSLKRLRFALHTPLPLIQLIGAGPRFDPMVTPEGLDAIARYANGIGPDKRRIEDASGRPVDGNALVRRAHARGLVVHAYTFRADDLPPAYGSLEDELRIFFGRDDVDGVFTDQPDRAVALVHPWRHGCAR